MGVRQAQENITKPISEACIFTMLMRKTIVIRGEEPSNSFLQICRVTDAKLAKDKKLIGNALYITDSGTIMITDFNGVKVDIAGSVYAGAVSAGYTDSPSKFGMDLYELIRKKQ